jgi:DNA polymerase gamma 1
MRPFIKDPDTHIGVKSNLSHLILKLKYEGSPMVLTKDSGWCYHDEEGALTKIPHPKGAGANVGGVLSKDFVEDMAVGRLSSDLPEAKRALEIANAVSYWTSVRKRVNDRIFLPATNPHGADALVTLPEILCHGTVTRRTVESLMVTMCSTKNWRIGTELKSRVQAPEGWKIVGADFDGQEMQIASIYSDKWEGGHIGCSPFGYNVLSGSKEAGTDPHSALAKLCGIDRDTAKIVGFAVLYGAGAKGVQTYIRRKYPEKSPTEVKNIAFKLLESKKGAQRNGVYEGGLDSGCFNFMEQIAMKTKVPQLPCLGTKISTAMRPAAVGEDFKTGRVNWTIQSSGAEILSIMLTAVHWLAREYKIPCRFVLSIHDEIWFMTPDKYAEQFAALFQIAHVYTWSLFHSAVEIPDLPLSRAYFSSVAIDERLRKSPKEKTVTLSNPEGNSETFGVEYSMYELAKIGAIDKLTTRFNAIQKGLIK